MSMKKLNLLFNVVMIVVFTASVTVADETKNAESAPAMPDNVKAIIDKSCFGCHNTGSKNEDAKKELDFKTFDNLTMVKKIGTLKEIGETVEKGEMPPKRFLERYPEKKLTDAEVKILTDWVKSESKTLLGK